MHQGARPHAKARLPRLIWLVFCLVSSPAIARAQTSKSIDEPTASASWLAAQTPRCGEVLGRIMRRVSEFDPESHFTPLPDAYVAVIDSASTDLGRGQRAESVARTDSAGKFHLRLPPSRTTVFEVKSIGYERGLIAVDGFRYHTVVLELVLGSNALHAVQQGVNVLTTREVTTCGP